MSASLEAVDLFHTYAVAGHTTQVLRGVDLAVQAGSLVGLAGPSGCGKSTLLRLLSGRERPTAGLVRIAGTTTAGLHTGGLRRLRRRHVGYVFQQPWENLLPGTTVEGHLRSAWARRGVTPLSAQVAEDLERAGLVGTHRADHLDVAQQQQLGVIAALAGDPAVVLADEPTAALDGEGAMVVADLLAEAARRGIACLVATHDHVLVERCDAVVSMRAGAVATMADGGTPWSVISTGDRLQLGEGWQRGLAADGSLRIEHVTRSPGGA